VNVVSVAVLYRAPYKCAVARHVKVENIHVFQSHLHNQRNSELWSSLFSALCHIVCACYGCIKTACELRYLYIFSRNILCGRLLVRMVCVCVCVWGEGKDNIEVCLVVILVSLLAQ